MKTMFVEKRTKTNQWNLPIIFTLAVTMLFGNVFGATAMAQTRIAVLPFYVEEGADSKEGGKSTLHYRRMMRFINNQLTRHGCEVINPFAKDASEKEYNRLMERAREDSSLACLEMCKKYSVDIAYVVWMKVKVKKVDNDLYKAHARVDGEGYDSAGRDLGAGLSKTFYMTKDNRDDAIYEAEKEVGDLVGRTITKWSGRKSGSTVISDTRPATVVSGGDTVVDTHSRPAIKGGVVQRRADELENLISIRLAGATEYELTEVFGKVLNTVTGVVEAKRYSSRIVPDNPQGSFMTWRVQIQDSDPFRIQANTVKMINDILDAGGDITLKGVPYRYSAAEVDMLKGIRPGDTTSREIQFVIDRERSRDREFEQRHDPYKAKGFE